MTLAQDPLYVEGDWPADLLLTLLKAGVAFASCSLR